MQPKPEGWPADAVVEGVPEIRARFRSSAWPPARDGLPSGTAAVGEWSVNRNLTGGGLPGQARGASGGAIAQGNFNFSQPDGAPLSPFTSGALAVQPGGLVDLSAWQGGASIPLGSFQARSIAGASTAGSIDVEIEESAQRLKRPFTYQWSYDPLATQMDAAHVIEAAAAVGGYRGGREPLLPSDSRVLIDAQLNGRTVARDGGTFSAGLLPRWGNVDGRIGLTSGLVKFTPSGGATSPGLNVPHQDVTFFVEVGAAGATIEIGQASGPDGLRVRFDRQTNALILSRIGASVALATYPLAWIQEAHTFLVRLTRPTSTSSSVTVQLCRDDETAWVTLGTLTASGLHQWTREDSYTVGYFTSTHTRFTALGWVRSFQAYYNISNPNDLPLTSRPIPTARVQDTGSLLAGVFNLKSSTCWEVIQDAAKSTMGGAWMDETGTLIYRNRESLRSGRPVETVIAEERLDTLAWETSVEDIADRVELTYRPTSVASDALARITLWKADAPYSILANSSIEILVNITGSTDRTSGFLPIWDTTTAGEDGVRMSRWAASRSRNGDGERPEDSSLSIRARVTGPSQVKITITNRTAYDLWTVDGNGNPCLILRTTLQVAIGDELTVSAGKPESSSITPFTFSAGSWVQDAVTAQEMLGWLASQTAQAEPTIPGVGVKPDLTRQLGDIVVVTDDFTQLRSKALITGAAVSGDHAGYQQHLTMALLAETFRSLDAWCLAKKITTFTGLDAALASAGVVTFDDFDAWCRAELVTY